MSLQQQIQREIDEAAKMERFLEKKKLKILKLPKNRCYELVNSKDKADAILIFNSKDFTKYTILAYKKEEEKIIELESSPNIFFFLLRNTNRRDVKRTTQGTIKSTLIPISKLKK